MNINSSDLIFALGDSITAGFGGSQPLQTGYFAGIRSAYGTPNCPPMSAPFWPSPRWPRNIGVNALAGRATGDVSGVMAALLAPYQRATAVFVVLSANDAAAILAATLTVPQFSINTLAIVDAFNSIWGVPYSKICWIGPFAWPTLTTQVAQVEASLTTNAALRGFQLIKCSQVPYPTSSTIGDGVHPNLAGVTAMTPAIMAGLTFS